MYFPLQLQAQSCYFLFGWRHYCNGKILVALSAATARASLLSQSYENVVPQHNSWLWTHTHTFIQWTYYNKGGRVAGWGEGGDDAVTMQFAPRPPPTFNQLAPVFLGIVLNSRTAEHSLIQNTPCYQGIRTKIKIATYYKSYRRWNTTTPHYKI